MLSRTYLTYTLRQRVLIICAGFLASIVFAITTHAQAPENPDPYARYTSPRECVPVTRRSDFQLLRGTRTDTIVYAPLRNPAQRASVQAVVRCVSRFQVNEVLVRDLPGLGHAYIAAEQYERADSAFQRWMQELSTRPVAERAWALTQIVDLYVNASPSQLNRARMYLARLDKLGKPAVAERIQAYLHVAGQARFMDDLPLLDTLLAAARAANREMANDSLQQKIVAPFSAFLVLAEADRLGRSGNGEAATAVLERGRETIPPLRPRASLQQVFDAAMIYGVVGKPAPPVQATQWFNDSTGGQRPGKGTLALVVFVATGCVDACYPGYATLRRLQREFPSLQVTFVTKTFGFYESDLMPPEEEMRVRSQWFLDRFPNSIGVAVWRTDRTRRETDRRFMIRPSPNEQAYASPDQMEAYVVDSAGVIRLRASLGPGNEIRMRNVLREL